LSVDQRDLHIARQPQMLQSVVRDDDARAVSNGGLRRGDAIAAHVHRNPGAQADQQSLVADVKRPAILINAQDIGGHAPIAAAPISPRNNRHRDSEIPQPPDQPDYQRRLAGSADRDVADDDDRRRDAHAAATNRAGTTTARNRTATP
jgi:hypothetical protein